MKRIQLTQQGEFLLPFPSEEDWQDSKLRDCRGMHKFCKGWISFSQVTSTHNALFCGRCNFRLLIPVEVDTWAKLETHMKCNLY